MWTVLEVQLEATARRALTVATASRALPVMSIKGAPLTGLKGATLGNDHALVTGINGATLGDSGKFPNGVKGATSDGHQGRNLRRWLWQGHQGHYP
mmetsp:Transcript_7696/g.16472  ORF Transcript_7696/g.16472 Transcript_7696/m.16472 type:complete len:96 (+) Transcript_7696:184-471(+)